MDRATDADWDDIATADARAFGMTVPIDDIGRQELSPLLPNDTLLLVRDQAIESHPLVGLSAFYRMRITPPGGTPQRAAGLTWVSVAPTHRRRGILRTMLTELSAQWRAEGYAFAILTATEATIYERFGFGVAMFVDRVSIPTGAQWRSPATTHGEVHYASTTEAAQTIPQIHQRWAAQHPGAITRDPAWWTPIFADRPPERRPGYTQLFYLLHSDGYAMYRMKTTDTIPDVDVVEAVAVTDAAHSALWRVLTSLDRTGSVHAELPADDSLPLKLNNFRDVRTVGSDDTVWVAILDVAAALTARRYAADVATVLDVVDDFGSAGGRFALTVSDGAASVSDTDAPADLFMPIAALGSLYFGGRRATELARAGRISGTAEAIAALDAALATERQPVAGTFF